MGADNQSIGSDWRGWGVRAGLVSVMAATGMVLAGHAANATTTMTPSPATQADGGSEGLPLDLPRLPDGNSGATCGGDGGGNGGTGGAGGIGEGGIGVSLLNISALGTQASASANVDPG